MTSRIVTLTSSDNISIDVERDVINQSILVKTLLTDLNMDDEEAPMAVPLPKVTAEILQLVLTWCQKHKGDPEFKEVEGKSDLKLPQWDQDFFKVFDTTKLFYLTLAANYMDVKMLLEYCAKTISDTCIKNKKAEEIRKIFNVVNDFTKEEEDEIRRENEWCTKSA